MDGTILIYVAIAVIAIIGAFSVYKVYKTRKADDGKIDALDIVHILMELSSEFTTVLAAIKEANDDKAFATIESKRKYFTEKIEYIIENADIPSEDKALLKGFGLENIATLIIKK